MRGQISRLSAPRCDLSVVGVSVCELLSRYRILFCVVPHLFYSVTVFFIFKELFKISNCYITINYITFLVTLSQFFSYILFIKSQFFSYILFINCTWKDRKVTKNNFFYKNDNM